MESGSVTTRWVVWAICAVVTFAAVAAAVFVGEMNSGLLLGWAVGMIISAMLVLFGRRT